MQVNIKNLIDDTQCYDTVRELRWPEGRECPFCESRRVIRRGFDEKESARLRQLTLTSRTRNWNWRSEPLSSPQAMTFSIPLPSASTTTITIQMSSPPWNMSVSSAPPGRLAGIYDGRRMESRSGRLALCSAPDRDTSATTGTARPYAVSIRPRKQYWPGSTISKPAPTSFTPISGARAKDSAST